MNKIRNTQAKMGPSRLYLIPVLSKALDILELLQLEHQPKTLEEIYQRTSISKMSVTSFRPRSVTWSSSVCRASSM